MAERWLIVGLGNPGPKYEGTRHNIGFHVLHALARKTGIAGKQEGRFQAMAGSGRWGSHALVLAQPLTYMNLSGEAVSKLMHYYDIPPERLLVIYDDVALPFGKIRVRPGGSAGGQKGMKSIIQHLGGNDRFPRLRVGISAPPIPQLSMPDYVLGRFSSEEQRWLPDITELALDAVELVLDQGVEAAMTRYNGVNVIPQPDPPAPPPVEKPAAPAPPPESGPA